MKKLKWLGIVCILSAVSVHAQQTTAAKRENLSASQQILYDKYMSGMNKSGLYSGRRQLYLDSALSLTPQNAFLWQQKGMPLFKLKKYEIGLPYLDSAVKYNHAHYIDYRGFMKCIFQKTYAAAILDFKDAKTSNGFSFVMDHSYDFYMGLCYLQLNRFQQADSCLAISLDFDVKRGAGGHFLEYFYLGISKMEQEDYHSAINAFDSALKAYNNFSDVKYYKAFCLRQLKQANEASALYREGLKNISEGYTITEDNVIYEEWPYQVDRRQFESVLEVLEKKGN